MAEPAPKPDTATQVFLGCAAAFMGLMGLLVIATLTLGIVSGQIAGPAIVVELVFLAVAVGALLLIRWGWRQAAERQRQRALHPGQPLAWRADWSAGRARGASPIAGVLFFGLFAAFWLGMMTIITVFGWDNIRKEKVATVMIAIFWAAGIFLATMAVIAILRALRFGASTLVLDTNPARLGGWLSGVIQGPLSVQGAEVQLAVECVRIQRRAQQDSTRWVYWRMTKVLDGSRFDRLADHVEIPFAIRLPENVEATQEPAGGSGAVSLFGSALSVTVPAREVDWFVSVKAKLPGVDWEDRFAVPVAEPEPAAAPVPDRPPRAMPELSAERLVERMPGRVEYQPDADVFIFPLKPSLVLWPLVLGAVAVGVLLFGDVPPLAGLPPAVLKWTPIVCGVLAALSLVGLLLDPRRIEVGPAAVRIRRGLWGVGVHRTIPRQEITEVAEETSRTDPPIYVVKIRLRNGKSYGVAPTLHQPDRAAALATRLRQILQLA